MLKIIVKRLPVFNNILPVYAITAFMVYGWTLLIYFRYLHYWLDFLNIGEILAIFCYAMVADLVESLIILFILLGVCIILPSRFLKDVFVVRGTLLVVCVFLSVSVFLNNYPDLNNYSGMFLPWSVITLIGAILIAFILPKISFIARAAVWLSDSMIIFLYIFMPVAALSLLVVLVRNLV